MLSLLLACPLIGMLVILALPRTAVRAIRLVALCATGFALVVGLQLLNGFAPHATLDVVRLKNPFLSCTSEDEFLNFF